MLEQYSQLTIKAYIDKLLFDIKKSALPMPEGWSFSSAEEAVEIIMGKGLVLLQWRKPYPSDKMKASFSYEDCEAFPFLSLVFDGGNHLQELEIWRGDDKPLVQLPSASDLLEVPKR